MAHEHHSHSHSHHHHGGANYNRAFAFGILLNIAFVGAEAFYGYFAHSLSLLADAGHNLSDVLGLALAWGASWLATRQPTTRYTYGFRSASILAALTNAVILMLAVGGVIWEAGSRLRSPVGVATGTVMTVAGIGVVINGVTAMFFMRGKKADLNIRGAYLHMMADALISIGVVVTGAVIHFTAWNWLDPAVSILISLIIIFGTWQLLRESVDLAVQAVPAGIFPADVLAYLKSLDGVSAVHDLHIWGMSTTETAMTAHVVMPGGHPGDAFLASLAEDMKDRFRIHHCTLQVELGDPGVSCSLQSHESV